MQTFLESTLRAKRYTHRAIMQITHRDSSSHNVERLFKSHRQQKKLVLPLPPVLSYRETGRA